MNPWELSVTANKEEEKAVWSPVKEKTEEEEWAERGSRLMQFSIRTCFLILFLLVHNLQAVKRSSISCYPKWGPRVSTNPVSVANCHYILELHRIISHNIMCTGDNSILWFAVYLIFIVMLISDGYEYARLYQCLWSFCFKGVLESPCLVFVSLIPCFRLLIYSKKACNMGNLSSTNNSYVDPGHVRTHIWTRSFYFACTS